MGRGELGEIRRLETDHGTFAVKQELGSWPVDEAGASAAYHRVCWEAGIPIPEPLRAMTGGYTAQVDGERVRAYAWAELADPHPTLDPACGSGTLVARLHQVRHPWPTSEIDPWFEAPLVAGSGRRISRPRAPPARRTPPDWRSCCPPCWRSRRSSPRCARSRPATWTSGPTTCAAATAGRS